MNKTVQFKFKKNIDIGSLEAENDRFLLSAFVEKEENELIKNTDNHKCIVLGRTGSGKSAILKYLENNEKYIKRIDPESLSLRHLSNSNIINYFLGLGIKLDLFYKVLWKHVFIVELIKLHFNNNLDKSKSILDWLKIKKTDKKKQRAIDYLEKWEDKFWEDTEYRIKEIETSIEDKFQSEMGGNFNYINLKGSSSSTNSEKIKEEVIYKAQKVINSVQIEEINEIKIMMEQELFNKTQREYFILIDDLDREWVANDIVYDLIKALISTINEFSTIPNIKIIIALRTNILKKIFKVNITRGLQREKFNHLYLNVDWTENELKDLVNKRLKELMKDNYTNMPPTIIDILPVKSKKGEGGWEYILERSLMRPRDIIDFFNCCFMFADGKSKINWDIIYKAESEYSNNRLQALNDEWLENYGQIFELYSFLKSSKNGFKIEEIKDKFGVFILDLVTQNKIDLFCEDIKMCLSDFANNLDAKPCLKKILIILFDIGLIGIKINPETKVEYAYNTLGLIKEEDIIDDTKFYIHKMFCKALRINS